MLEITCTTRSYLFQLSSRYESERWATNLVHLASEAGHAVPGLIVEPAPEDDEILQESSLPELYVSHGHSLEELEEQDYI